MIKQRFIFVLLLVFLFTAADVSGYDKGLRDNFKNPPRQYSLLPLWSWNDTLEPDKLKWQIDQMVEKGVYGAFMHARVGINKGKTPYLSPGWWDAVNTTVTYGKEVGFYPWIYDEDKWPSGSAGGRTVAVNPQDFSQKGLIYSRMEIEGPQSIKLPSPDELVGIIAAKIVSRGVIGLESLTDISDLSGKQWSVPEGKWLIMTFQQIRDEEATSRPQRGIDYLDKEAVAAFINITHEEYYKRFGEYFGSVIPGIFFDEISAKLPGADFAWTDDFLEKFKERKEYDLKKYLPLLIYDGGDVTPKIRCDYYDVFTSLYVEAWFKQIGDWCSEHNIPLTGHTYEDIFSYVTQGDYFRTFAPLQIPLTDNEDFRYSFPRHIEWFKPKQLSSIAHLNGRKFAGAEALGGSSGSYTLEELRYGISMLGVYGINFMALHLFHYTTDVPWASADYPPSWFYQNPYWKYFSQVAKFAQRVSYMGSEGRHICDIAILFPITSQWTSGRYEGSLGLGKKYTIEELDDILSLQYFNVQKTLLDNQIDYDIIDPASILKSSVSEGKIEIAGGKYSVLILPPLSVIRKDVLERIKNFYENGGTVIAMNTLPLSSMEAGRRDPFVIKTVNDIFGFNPLFLRSGYFEIDKTYSNKFITNANRKNGKAYFTKEVENVPLIVEKSVDRDIIIKEGAPAGFHFLHRTAGDYDIYYLVNSQRVPKQWKVSFRCTGGIEKWHPETGQIEKIYGLKDDSDRTEISLSFKPWETYYVVFDKSESIKHNIALGGTNLKNIKIADIKENKIKIQGWEPTGTDSLYVNITKGFPKKEMTKKWESKNSLSEIKLGGKWDFIPVGKMLDYKWQPTVRNAQLELPVMEFYPARTVNPIKMEELLLPESENIYWKQIKIKDTWSKVAGCGRYLSCWDGWWITYSDLKPHWGTLGGNEIKFRKKVIINDAVKNAQLSITADRKYKLSINGKIVGEDDDWRIPETYNIASYLKTGENLFEVLVKDAGALLLQAEIALANDRNIKVVSNRTWEVSSKGGIWGKAFEYVNPPLGPWGNIELKKEPLPFPVNVWYRRELPAGAIGMTAPVIKGDCRIFVNGQTVKLKRGQERTIFRKLLNDEKNILLVKVNVKDYSEGIIEPITIICEPLKVTLDLWENYGLDWYSGRCLYSKEFVITDEYLAPDTKLVLNLGEVKYFVEVWINNKLVSNKIWPPFQVEIQDYLKADENTINLVIANLIANEMKWNIFDESLTTLRARWVQDLGISREPDRLSSGILGPVKIIPFKKTSFEITILD